jgi:hypothetical protein
MDVRQQPEASQFSDKGGPSSHRPTVRKLNGPLPIVKRLKALSREVNRSHVSGYSGNPAKVGNRYGRCRAVLASGSQVKARSRALYRCCRFMEPILEKSVTLFAGPTQIGATPATLKLTEDRLIITKDDQGSGVPRATVLDVTLRDLRVDGSMATLAFSGNGVERRLDFFFAALGVLFWAAPLDSSGREHSSSSPASTNDCPSCGAGAPRFTTSRSGRSGCGDYWQLRRSSSALESWRTTRLPEVRLRLVRRVDLKLVCPTGRRVTTP